MFQKNPNAVGFLEEAPGIKSSTRLKTFFVMIFWFAWDYLVIPDKTFMQTTVFLTMNILFAIAVFAPQYLQKMAEMKFGNVPGASTPDLTVKQTTETKTEVTEAK